MKVANRKCIRRLGMRTLLAGRTRNLVAVLAIALTAMLFTSLFTIAMSINEGFQQSNFRQAGGFSHGGFKYLTKEQFEKLKEDPLIREWGLRRFLGMPTQEPFHKSHVEIGYSDEKEAHWMYCDPVEGRLPAEGTKEAATDTHVLELLGVEPEVGAEFTVTFEVDGHETTQSFVLCGWWEYDTAVVANHILIPESRLEEILRETGVTPPGSDQMTGNWNLDVMLKNGAWSIESDLEQIAKNAGYQAEDPSDADTYVAPGVNWGYTGAQLSSQMDPVTLLFIVGILLLILLTGYLIIYNVFQISAAGDIRFYGLLKTIGTTPGQLRRIVRFQALALSLCGIPLGLFLGWLLGGALTPVVAEKLDGVVSLVSVNPLIFVGSGIFALLTVLISCYRPGRMAGRVSPVEAVRYTEGASFDRKRGKAGGGRKGRKQAADLADREKGGGRNGKRVSLLSMAWANLGRSRGKTVVTILSLSLAVVLFTVTVILVNSFDMDKYIAKFTASDFILADAGKLQATGEIFNEDMALPETAVDAVRAQGGVEDGGRVYGRTSSVQEFVSEEYFRTVNGWRSTPENLDNLVRLAEKTQDGRIADDAQLYGMEPFALDHLTVLEGDLSPLYEPGGNYIAAVYSEDDYGNPIMDSHWAGLGDTVTLRYVEEYEYYNPDTGEIYGSLEDVPENAVYAGRAVKYRDAAYTVAALVTVPTALGYRYYGSDEFVLNAQTFIRDTGTDSVMYYAFDMTDEAADASMEAFLQDYTENTAPWLDYESKGIYAAEFDGFRNMFLLLGGALSFIVALVGVLNFFNAILTGITARRRELAVLQSIGMTGRQMKTMLALEGLLYTCGALALALLLLVATGPFAGRAVSSLIWFFTWHFTVWPVFLFLPAFVLLGIAIPVASCRAARKLSVVERLRVE